MTLLARDSRDPVETAATPNGVPGREEPRSWDRARWVNEVRRFETAWDVDAPRSVRQPTAEPVAPPSAVLPAVTLVVYEWQNAEPGTLSWKFTDLAAAVTAAGAMRNAVRWAVLAGEEPNVGRARELGLVLAETDAPAPSSPPPAR